MRNYDLNIIYLASFDKSFGPCADFNILLIESSSIPSTVKVGMQSR